MTRAREGVLRLQAILSALGAASRVEESIKQAQRMSFDLRALLEVAVAGYRGAATAMNRADGGGAIFKVVLPLI